MAAFSLENIYLLSDNKIKQILSPKYSDQDFLTNRLIATILLYNNNRIEKNDRKYVVDSIFKLLYLEDDDYLEYIAEQNSVETNVDRIKLIRKIIDVYNSYNEDKLNELLRSAIQTNQFGLVKILIRKVLDKGMDINMLFYGEPHLLAAAKVGNPEIVSLLLDNGANIEAVDDVDNNVLQVVIPEGDKNMIKFLLDRGAIVNVYNVKLAEFMVKEKIEIVEMLKQK